jgi:hypothetical protein
MRGFFRMDAVNKFSGKVRPLTGWMPNSILDAGRNVMATQANWATKCQVGTDGTTPTPSDTGLGSFVAGTDTVQATAYGAQSSAPYYGWKRTTYRFAEGVAAGNLSEAGVGWATTGATLVSRALIVDALGVPTTVTVLIDEFLDVTYELRYYPPLGDSAGTVELDGITYDTVTRAAIVTNSGSWGQIIGEKIAPTVGTGFWVAYDGAIGDITVNPSGNSANCDTADQVSQGYVNNSYYIDVECPAGPTAWNLGAGIRCLSFLTEGGAYKTSFTAQGTGNTIPKTDLFTMIMVWRVSWAEYIIP